MLNVDRVREKNLLSILSLVLFLIFLPSFLYCQFTIISRDEWDVTAPIGSAGPLAPHSGSINNIIIHHSGDANHEGPTHIDAIQNWHINGNGWSDIGYHYVITPDGRVYEARNPSYLGAHVDGYNNRSIGICVLGNYDTEQFSDNINQALQSLLEHLCLEHQLDSQTQIHKHEDYESTDCPGNAIIDDIPDTISNLDTDNDGLYDSGEDWWDTDPFSSDTDGDGLKDGDEVTHGLDPKADDSLGDADNDGLLNGQECWYGTNPFNSDTDGGGISDYDEVVKGLNPLNPGDDHPDEFAGVSGEAGNPSPFKPGPLMINLFYAGWKKHTLNLLHYLKESAIYQAYWFNPENIIKYPIMIIPSGGLQGFERSEILKAKFEKYVEMGGRLIVFGQQQGYEFNILPGTPSGYGFREDQSCHGNAAQIDEYHQVLSSQKDLRFDGGIDGFFSQWPNDAKVLLRRTKNNMPALILYPYGSGYVIATTLYSDFSYAQGSITQDELSLMKDIIAWAKNPKDEYVETKPNEQITIPINITNSTNTDANKVKFVIRDSLSVIREEIIDLLVPAGQTITYNYSFVAPSNLGIYSVSYSLMTNDQLLMTNIFADNFSVTQHLQGYIEIPGLQYYISVPSEEVIAGTSTIITFHIINNTDEKRTGRIDCQWGGEVRRDTCIDNFEISQGEHRTIPYQTGIARTRRFNSWLVDSNGQDIAYSGLGFTIISPSVNISLSTDKKTYKPSDEVKINYIITNPQNISYSTKLEVSILSPNNVKIFSKEIDIELQANKTYTDSVVYKLPDVVDAGIHLVGIEATSLGKKIGSSIAYFDTERVRVVISPTIPSIDPTSDNQITFDIKNTGAIDAVAKLDLTLKDPDNIIAWTSSKEFSLGIGEQVGLDFTLPIISNLKFGNYKLFYKITTTTGTAQGSQTLSNSAVMNLTFDKPSYRVRESMNISLSITNTGKFIQDIGIEVKIAGSIKTDRIIINPQETKNLSYTITIPDYLTYGSQNVDITLSMANQIKKSWTFFIPESKLQFSMDKLSYNIGESGQIKVENTGGVDTSYDYRLKIDDLKNINILNTIGTKSIQAGQSDTISFSITNPQVLSGTYRLSLYCEDKKTKKKQVFERYLEISGVSGQLSVETDKKMYMKGENITAKTKIKPTAPIQDAKLQIKVYSGEESITNYQGFGTIFAIGVDGEKVYFGTAQGFKILNKADKSTTTYTTVNGLSHNYVQCLVQDNDYVWLGTSNGLSRFDKVNKTFKVYKTTQGLINDAIVSLASDGNTLWIGTWLGVSKMDKLNETFENIHFGSGDGKLLEPRIYAIAVDGNKVYFGYYAKGVSIYDKVTNTWTEWTGLVDNQVRDIRVDEKDIWIATMGGVSRYNKQTGTFQNFTTSNGLPHNWTYAIGLDKNLIWIGTFKGLVRYDKVRNEFKIYTTSDGLTGDIIKAVGVDEDTIWMGVARDY